MATPIAPVKRPEADPPAAVAPPARPGGEAHVNLSRAVLHLIDGVLAQSTLADAAMALCTQLARLTGARRVCLGWLRNGRCVLTGVSDSADLALPPDQRQRLEIVMHEAIDQAVCIDSQRSGPGTPIAQSARALARLQNARVLTMPFAFRNEPLGAITIELPMALPAIADPQSLLAEVGRVAGELLPMIERQGWSRWRWLTTSRESRRTAVASSSPWRQTRRWVWIGLLTVAAVTIIIPLPHSVSADARIEGETQRVVAAPADGYLKDVLVRPGDRVRQGQALARLGERDLELERGRLTSETAQRRGEKSVAMAKGDRAAMMIAQAKMDESQAQIDLVEEQQQRFVLSAPIDGVLIGGDQTRAIGSPIERGQVLFTLAPVDRFRVIVELDERDIGAVHAGQTGKLALSALPWDTVGIRVVRLTAAAVVIDGHNVFEIEAEPVMASADLRQLINEQLRPGLRGVARLETESRSLLQVWSRRLASHLRRVVWRWWP